VRIDPKDMVAVLNDLQAEGLVTRTPDLTDRRKNAIVITAAGEELRRRLEALVDRANDALLAPLAPEGRAHLSALLARIVHYEAPPS
jgi:DNA-binding MarR family transcriptional regulator